MFGSSHFGYFGRFSDRLSPMRRSIRSPFKRFSTGRTAVFICDMTGEVISPLECKDCQNYTLIEGEEDLRTCHYRSPEQLEVEEENRRKTEEEIRRNEEITRELDVELVRSEDRRRSLEDEFKNCGQGEKGMEIEDGEKQEDDWEKAFQDQEEETEDVGDDVGDDEGGDDTLHNSARAESKGNVSPL
jgi:hypothetical protein